MRTEQDVLKDFEELGWKVSIDNKYNLIKLSKKTIIIRIFQNSRSYEKYFIYDHASNLITITEHKLLNELFTIWGWI